MGRRKRPVYDAAGRGETQELERLLKDGADPDESGPLQTTALHAAVQSRHAHAALLLLARGAAPDPTMKGQKTPVISASLHGLTDVVTALIERGVRLDHKAHATAGGDCALTAAARRGHVETCRALLQAGARTDVLVNGSGRSALCLAAEAGHRDVVALLLEAGARVDAAPDHGTTALGWAAAAGRTAVCNDLLDAGAAVGEDAPGARPPLLEAAKGGQVSIVKALLDRGAPVSSLKGSLTALMAAAMARRPGHAHVDRSAVIDLLIERGADVAIGRGAVHGRTALHWAVLDDGAPGDDTDIAYRLRTVESLLKAGAPVDPVDDFGATPLMEAAGSAQVEVVSRLLEAGADPAIRDRGRAMAIHRATRGSGYALPRPEPEARARVVRLLIGAGSPLQAFDASGVSPLMGAAFCGLAGATEALLAQGADPNEASPSSGATALHFAVGGISGTGRGLADESLRLACVERLLGAGSDPDLRDAAGETPLELARRLGMSSFAAVLAR